MKNSKILKQKSKKLKRKTAKTDDFKINIKNNSINQTTIKLMKETKGRLNKLKEYERESYDQILRKMLYVLNVCRQNPEKAKKILEEISIIIKREKEFKKEDIE